VYRRRRDKLASPSSHYRRREWRYDVGQGGHLWQLARGHQFDVVTFVSHSLIDVEQRQTEHPNGREHDLAALQDDFVSDGVPGRRVRTEWRQIDAVQIAV